MPGKTLKLVAPPGFHLPDLNDLDPGLTADAPEEQRIETTYYDTPDLRLVRSGCSLRFRAPEGWRLTIGDRKLVLEGKPQAVPPLALRLLAAYRLGSELHPVARLSTWRHRVTLRDEQGAQALAVVDDEVSVLEGRRVAARFREVEVEAETRIDERVLETVHERLVANGAGNDGSVPKLVRALGPPAERPPDVRAPEVDPLSSAGEVLRAAIAGAAESLLAQDAALRLGDDPDAIRKVRVACRRLRSRIQAFSSLLDEEWTESITNELSWLADQLSAVRDLDVRAGRVRRLAEGLEGDQRPGLGLAELAASGAGEARKQLGQALDSERYLGLLQTVAEAATAPPVTGAHGALARDLLPKLAVPPWRKLRRAAGNLGPSPGGDELHRVRIRCKRARYAAEAVAQVIPEAGELATALDRVQTALGEHHDSATAQAWLREHAGSGRRAFAAGRMYELEAAAAAAAVKEFREAWQTANRRRLRKWME
ncbi:MAG TPA: CYTH and CHAD domain-containing protein [Candidatus Dormibacteraeota bacterium]